MSGLASVCVYCGSSPQALAQHLDLAERFGAALAERGLRMVFGGGGIGLMGACARAAHAKGGAVLGVMPHFLARLEPPFTEGELRMVDTMSERKVMMAQEADGFVVLPGGIGTLEEAVETLSWRRLDLHEKPVVFLAEDGFWDPFFALIDHFIAANLLPAAFSKCVMSARSVEEAFQHLTGHAPSAAGTKSCG